MRQRKTPVSECATVGYRRPAYVVGAPCKVEPKFAVSEFIVDVYHRLGESIGAGFSTGVVYFDKDC